MKFLSVLKMLVGSEKGIASLIRETGDPNKKISSRRGAGLLLLGTAATMSQTIDWSNMYQFATMIVFAFLGTILLIVASSNFKK